MNHRSGKSRLLNLNYAIFIKPIRMAQWASRKVRLPSFAPMGTGAEKRDYPRIMVPVLAFFPSKGTQKIVYNTEEHRIAVEQFDAATKAYVDRWKKNLMTAPGSVRSWNCRERITSCF